MPLHIHRQLLILELALTRPLHKMHMHNTLTQRALHKEPEAQVLGAPLVRLSGAADVPVARPSRPGSLAVRGDLGRWAEERGAARVGADEGDGAVEEGGFGGRGEDVGEEEGGYARLGCLSVAVW
jgi:hypothetical protein